MVISPARTIPARSRARDGPKLLRWEETELRHPILVPIAVIGTRALAVQRQLIRAVLPKTPANNQPTTPPHTRNHPPPTPSTPYCGSSRRAGPASHDAGPPDWMFVLGPTGASAQKNPEAGKGAGRVPFDRTKGVPIVRIDE